MPATTEVTPSVLVMVRVAWALRVSVSVAVTRGGVGGEAVAVLVRVPVAEELMVATTV